MEAVDVCRWFRNARLGPFTGVPDSTLAALQRGIAAAPDLAYYGATGEGEAMGIAAGWALGGRTPAVLMQNSGLGNAVNPLTSLFQVFRLPVVLVVGWRGEPGSKADAVEHAVMGERTLALLDALRVAWEILPDDAEACASAIARLAETARREGMPAALVVRRGMFSERADCREGGAIEGGPLCRESPVGRHVADGPAGAAEVGMREALEAVLSVIGERAGLVATTGFVSRLAYEIRDLPNCFYMVGSMGCAAPIGFGLAVLFPNRKFVVLDGDGALLMKMGALATIGHYAPENLLHVVLDNGMYASTGGQACVSRTVDFCGVAEAAGYCRVGRALSAGAIRGACNSFLEEAGGPRLLHVPVRAGDCPTLRPRATVQELRDRFRVFCKGN